MKKVLKGKEWSGHIATLPNDIKQEQIYRCTHNYEAIYNWQGYYFSFSICRGYKDLSVLKRLISQH